VCEHHAESIYNGVEAVSKRIFAVSSHEVLKKLSTFAQDLCTGAGIGLWGNTPRIYTRKVVWGSGSLTPPASDGIENTWRE
jgi:hypothetical protein